ncbi:hypothetical protein ACWCSH_27535, partial [Streptosporangium sp. NPDC001682]
MLNNKRHGKLAAVAVMAATALAITSCGSSEPAKPAAGDGGASAAAEPVTITVHHIRCLPGRPCRAVHHHNRIGSGLDSRIRRSGPF